MSESVSLSLEQIEAMLLLQLVRAHRTPAAIAAAIGACEEAAEAVSRALKQLMRLRLVEQHDGFQVTEMGLAYIQRHRGLAA